MNRRSAATLAQPMPRSHPLADAAETDSDDLELVRRIQNGDRDALESLVRRHQDWVYNIAVRMVYLPEDAEDATQEILIKLLTKLSTFEGRSSFRTWLYRLVCNHVLNMKRGRADKAEWTFLKYRRELESTPDLELPDPRSVPADVQLLVDEARIGCTSGMLLCLDREQRLIYILGDIFDVSDRVGAELLEMSRDNFRQKLSRARRDLHSFMREQCGLVNKANPCRCAKKTQAFIQAGYVNPQNLLFATTHVTRVREVSRRVHQDINELDAACAEIHRDHPFHPAPDFVKALRDLLDQPRFRSILEPH